jgi:hypothetical protein
MKVSTSELLYQAMVAKYESDVLDAKARLSVYFNNPVAIGEHPQHTEEIDHLVDQLASAQDKLENLKKVYQELV